MLADKLRKSVLQSAIQGKLTEQLATDDKVEDLLQAIKEEKELLIKEKKIKKQKPLPEITEEEIPFEIPENWRWVRLGEISLLNIGLTFKPTEISNEGTIVLRSSNIKNGKIDLSDIVRINKEIPVSKLAKKNDLLICVRNGSKKLVGKTAIIENDNFAFGAFMSICRSKCYKYLYYYLSSPLFRGNFDSVTTTTINQITQTNLKNRIVPLPPLAEQKRIVEKLDNVLANIDELKANEEKLSILQRNFPDKLKKSILQSAIQGKLTEQLATDDKVEDLLQAIKEEKERLIKEKKIKKQKPLPEITEEEIPFEIPKNWKWVRLGEIGITQTGNTPSRLHSEYIGNDIPFITPKDISDKGIIYNNQGLSELGKTVARICNKDTILQVCIGGSIGKTNIVNREVAFNQQINSIYPIFCISRYVFMVMQSAYFIIKMRNKAGGTATPIINRGIWDTILIPLPSLAEQKRIVEKLDKLLADIEELKIE
jgi:type I restriction enzyme S subunit